MNTALDTNILIALWDEDMSDQVTPLLGAVHAAGTIVLPAPVFAELMALPGRTPAFIEQFCQTTGIQIGWDLSEPVWRLAGGAFQTYSAKRRRSRESQPRRILADFLIGAYASHHNCQLLTFDQGVYKTAYPTLKIVSP